MKRRDLLKATGAAATVSAVGLAGCSSVPFLGGDDNSTGSFSAASSWLPEPQEVSDNLDHYSFTARTPSGIHGAVDDVLWEASQGVSTDFGRLSGKNVEYAISVSTSVSDQDSFSSSDIEWTVYTGSFDTNWVADKIEHGTNYSSTSEMTDGRTLFRPEEARSSLDAYAVDENQNVIVQVGGSDSTDSLPSAEGIAKLLFETNTGEAPTYAEQEDMSELASSLSMGHTMRAETQDETDGGSNAGPEDGVLKDLVASGSSYTIDGSNTNIEEVLVFSEQRSVDENDIQTYIAESGEFSRAAKRPSYSITGRRVSIEWTVTTWPNTMLY